MKRLLFIICLTVVLAVIIFSIQNNEVVQVNFLFWKTQSSRTMLMLTCFLLGAISMLAAIVPFYLSKSKKEYQVPYDFSKKKKSEINN